MQVNQGEAVVVLCKCREQHKLYGIRAEQSTLKQWRFTWAFPINNSSAKREGFDKTTIGGDIVVDSLFPGCPYCGRSDWIVCSCGHLSCAVSYNDYFTCEWCGNSGKVNPYAGRLFSAGLDT